MNKLWLVLVPLVLGCSPSPEEACDKLTPAFCAKLNECLPFQFRQGYADTAACASRIRAMCIESFTATGTSTNTSRVSDCATQIMPVSCEDLYASKTPEACKPLAGAVVNGAACVDNAQCASTWCARGDNMTCGACGPKPTAGTSCANQECGEGLSCVNDVCVVPGMAGAQCDGTHPCRAGYACKGVTPGGMGTCALGLSAGTMCESLMGPNNAGCDQTKGLYCHPTTRVCTAVTYAKTGEACGVVGMGFAVCASAGTCKMQGAATMGTCIAPAADGAPCDSMAGPKCSPPARCVSGLCKLEDPATCK